MFRDDLMDKFHVPVRALPLLGLEYDGVVKGRLEPRGLWIVGANGRVDLIVPPVTSSLSTEPRISKHRSGLSRLSETG